MLNPVVLDIETKNTFLEVGQGNHEALEVSLVCTYSYARDEYVAFEETQMKELEQYLQAADTIIGFCINNFDLPVLKKHFDLSSKSRIDLFDEIELKLGRRVGLNVLAQANLGVGKTHSSMEAPELYRDGKMEELKKYCINDVKLTKDLYELAKRQGYLMVPKKGLPEEMERVPLALNTLF